MSIVGNTYLERGNPVVVVTQWAHSTGDPTTATAVLWVRPPARTGPRNVRIRRADGTEVVRGFRGLRRPPQEDSR